MRVTAVTLKKNFKIGMPNYSNMDIGVVMTWEVGENEKFDFSQGWDIINQQLEMQAGTTDQSWINVAEYKNKYKATVNIPKQEVK